jgi:hypothetical protein
MVTMNRILFYDILERCVWTFIQAFLASWTVTSIADVTNAGIAMSAAMAGLAAAVSLLKSIAASRIGGFGAATLPGSLSTLESQELAELRDR